MAVRSFEGKKPQMAISAYIDEMAVLIGDVVVGEDSSIWPMSVLRGDINTIQVGKRTNIQDGTIVHVSHAGDYNPTGNAVFIGDDVTIGHKVMLHGCTISDRCLIGIGSIVMDNVIIEPEVIVGAGSLVPPGKHLKSGYLWLGNPVNRVRPLTEKERSYLIYSADYYAALSKKHA